MIADYGERDGLEASPAWIVRFISRGKTPAEILEIAQGEDSSGFDPQNHVRDSHLMTGRRVSLAVFEGTTRRVASNIAGGDDDRITGTHGWCDGS